MRPSIVQHRAICYINYITFITFAPSIAAKVVKAADYVVYSATLTTFYIFEKTIPKFEKLWIVINSTCLNEHA